MAAKRNKECGDCGGSFYASELAPDKVEPNVMICDECNQERDLDQKHLDMFDYEMLAKRARGE